MGEATAMVATTARGLLRPSPTTDGVDTEDTDGKRSAEAEPYYGGYGYGGYYGKRSAEAEPYYGWGGYGGYGYGKRSADAYYGGGYGYGGYYGKRSADAEAYYGY